MKVAGHKKIGPMVAAISVAGLGACAPAIGPYVTRTDQTSPAAARVDALVQANQTYPRWADFPRGAPNPPSAAVVAAEVSGLAGRSQALGRDVSAMTWEITDPAALARSLDARTAGADMSPATAQTAAEVEAFARRLRERSVPPPPLD